VDADLAGQLCLLTYAAIALALVVRSIRNTRDGWGVWLLYAVLRLYVPLIFRWRATNPPSPFPADGGALIIANHRSPADPLIIWMNHHLRKTARRDVRVIGFLTAREYCELRGLRWLSRNMRCIPVERDGHDTGPTREAIRRLRDGQLVGIFPEGMLHSQRDLHEGNPGVAYLALKARVPVIPVYIHDAPRPTAGMSAPFRRRCHHRVRLSYGDAVDLTDYASRRMTPEVLAEVTSLLMSRLAALGNVGFTPTQLRFGNGDLKAERAADSAVSL